MFTFTWSRFTGLLMVLIICFTGCTATDSSEKVIRTQIEAQITNLLQTWYPVSLDTVHGGYLSDLSYDWKPNGRQSKMLVSQARHVWTSSQAAMFLHDDYYRQVAEHGYKFLRDVMQDTVYGGFYLLRDQSGKSVGSFFSRSVTDEKTAYSHAFTIYALASYYQLTGDKEALDLAIKTFHWLDEHSWDPVNMGYVDRMNREGVWFGKAGLYKNARRGLARDYKDQNSSIHIMEAFTQLYTVWPDEHLRTRLQQMLEIIRDKIVGDKPYLTMFLELDWTPITFRDSSAVVREANSYYDNVSFGHDVETAFLMLEASHTLGIENDTKTLAVGKSMVDHALANGWDDSLGGFYYEGYYFNNVDTCTIINSSKEWWVQAEGLNSLLLMHKLYPNDPKYLKGFEKMWSYIDTYLIDHENGGWYTDGLDNSPKMKKANKAGIWKADYHNYRALMNTDKMLRGDFELTDHAGH